MKKILAYSTLLMAGVAMADNTSTTNSKKVDTVSQTAVINAKEIQFNNLDQIQLPMSDQDFNSIVVKNDKISQITCPPMYCQSKINDDGTAQFIATTQLPFTVPVYTNNGLLFTLQVMPVHQPGKTYSLVPMGGNPSKKTIDWAKNSDYSQILIDVLKDVINGKEPDGYSYHAISDNAVQAFTPKADTKIKLDLAMLGIYRGDLISVVVIKLTNNGIRPIPVRESEFYSRSMGVRAVALSSLIVPAKGATFAYLVVNNDNQEGS